MKKLAVVQDKLAKQGRLGPVARLLPTTAATTLRKDDPPLVLDGPFAETKEQLLGFYVVDCEQPRRGARRRARPRQGQSRRRLRNPPGRHVHARERQAVTDTAWIDAALTSARPQAVGALLRYFRDLDTAEEAFQNACLRALKNWPENGPPRDPAAWLIMVGRNVAIDDIRRGKKQQPLPEEEAISDLGDAEEQLRRAARRFALSRRHPAAAVHLLPSGPAGDAADRARAAHRLRPDGQADRARLPGLGSRDGAAHHPRQGARRRRRRAVRDAGRGRALRASHLRRRHDLPDLQRGLFGLGRYRRGPRTAVRGGDPPGPAAAAAVPERARDHGADRAAADPACARRGALRRRWRGDPARRSGPLALEQGSHRRGAGADRQGDASSPQRALSSAGRDRGAACPCRKARRYRLDPDRPALWRARDHAAVAGGDAEPRGRRIQGAGSAGRRST